MNRNYHPTVDFAYFAFVTGFTVFFMNPVCVAASLLSGICHSLLLGRKNGYVIWVFLAAAFANPLFNHEGATVLFYLPNGNPFTFEAMLYGLSAAAVLAAVILHFSCFNGIFTSDKLLYLFARVSPSLSLVVSMTLHFVPEFRINIRKIADAGAAAGYKEQGLLKEAKKGVHILSAAISQSLENSIETADSMRARGYGIMKRSTYLTFRFDKRDLFSIVLILSLSAYVLSAGGLGAFYFKFYPTVRHAAVTPYHLSAEAAFAILCFLPVISGIKEELVWKQSESKI